MVSRVVVALALLIFPTEGLVAPRAKKNVTVSAEQHGRQTLTFPDYYATVTTGRGIWKWNNALIAYERHFGHFKGAPVEGTEVGVQSGGSLVMWRAVLGDQITMHGVDINPSCAAFADAKTSITIGDQSSVPMWSDFFTKVAASLDFLVDDGGHLASQMVTTTQQSWPKIKAGGVLSIEDIHGGSYLEPFFKPVAEYFASTADVSSVHVYPYLLIAHKTGGTQAAFDPSLVPGAVVVPITDTQSALDNAIHSAAAGSIVVFEDPAGQMLSKEKLQYVFWRFNNLHVSLTMEDKPVGCTGAEVPRSSWHGCNYYTTNSPLQSRVTAVHVLPSRLVVEIAWTTPVIEAIRRGDQWVRWPADTPKGQELQYFNTFLANHGNAPAVHFFAPPAF